MATRLSRWSGAAFSRDLKKLDKLVRAEYKDSAVQIIDKQKRVHMAHMDITFQIL